MIILRSKSIFNICTWQVSGLLISAIILMFTAGCSNNKRDALPEGVLPDTQMVSILTDIYLIEGVMVQLEYIRQKDPGSGVPYYAVVFEKHNVSRDQFRESLEHYIADPEKMDKIYDKLIQKLGKTEIELRKEGEVKEEATEE